jgi:hypothetical protein
MQSNTSTQPVSFLFVGNRSCQISLDSLSKFNEDSNCQYLTFKGASPIEDNQHQIIWNNDAFTFAGEYDMDELKSWLKNELLPQIQFSNFTYLVCDPTERFTQAVLACLLEDIYLQEVLGKNTPIPSVIWLYPMGMASYDLRKELSHCIMDMKRAEIPVYLLRYQHADMTVLFYELVKVLEHKPISQIENEWFIVEQLIGKNKSTLING